MASQRQWLSKAANKNYFRGPENVRRVQRWRQAHPDYWRTNLSHLKATLQDDLLVQDVEPNEKSGLLKASALHAAGSTLVCSGLKMKISYDAAYYQYGLFVINVKNKQKDWFIVAALKDYHEKLGYKKPESLKCWMA